jgi:hypothetical protein
MLGPVQVLVVDLTDPKSARAVMASLAALAPEGPVRCLDVFECTVDDAGELSVTAQDGRQPLSLPLFAEEVDEAVPIPDTQDMWNLGEVVPPGGRAVVALLEHRWAIGLRESLLASGAALRYETWLDEDDRARLESLVTRARD